MVTGGDHVGTGIDRFKINIFGDPKTTRSILTIHDHKIEFQIGNQPRQSVPNRCPTCFPNHVTQKQKPHAKIH
ncbi:hypothetical protein D3C87_1650360 [compost metagenome]